jgi:hypothetical protein
MGILKEVAATVKDLNLPPGFSVCELGDQQMAGDRPRPALDFYAKLGCGRYVSVDANGSGTVTADLNWPLTHLQLGTFDLVTDFGTGEHIFDQSQVWRTIHDLTALGGYIAFDRPTDGYGKHGFYLVTTGLLEDLAQANQYRILRLERRQTPRGWLVRGIFRRPGRKVPFAIPQQRRYQVPRRAVS